MPLMTVVAATAAGTAALCVVGPRLLAFFIVRVGKQLLNDEALMSEVGRAAAEAGMAVREELAAIMWTEAMRQAFQEAIVDLLCRPTFREATAAVVQNVTRDRALKDTIRQGVLEATRDSTIKAEVKAVLIQGLQDEEMRNAMLRAARNTVKTGIREAVADSELKEVITDAIREALQDPRLNGVLRGALKDALADKELHRATFSGAVSALFPFKPLGSTGDVGDNGSPNLSISGSGSPHIESPERQQEFHSRAQSLLAMNPRVREASQNRFFEWPQVRRQP